MSDEVLQSQLVKKMVGFDRQACCAELARIPPAQWLKHVNQAGYEGDWSVIALNTLRQHLDKHPIIQSFNIETGDDWVELPILDELTAVSELLRQIPFTLKSIRLMKLDPGANIKEHRDLGLSIEHGEARLHIPLQCDEKIVFISNGKSLAMKEGELWYINADAPHSVQNKGEVSRINLVIDCQLDTKQWLDFIENSGEPIKEASALSE